MLAELELTLHDTLSRAKSALCLAAEIQESLWQP